MRFKQIREFFIFTHKERSGLLILLTILVLTILLDVAMPFLLPEKECDTTAWKQEVEKYYAAVPAKKEAEQRVFVGVFDPNRVEQVVLQRLGLQPGMVSNWIKYLQKGGRFKKKEEVMKLYGMTFEQYQKIEQFMVIPEKGGIQKEKVDGLKAVKMISSGRTYRDSLAGGSIKEKKKFAMLDLNRADSVQLEALPGIGQVFASRIIKYRRLLGGYYEVAQLKEIYGMTDELWSRCSPGLCVDTTGLKKLMVNLLSTAELGRHPYIGFRQAKKIIRARDTNGKFKQKEELFAFFSTDSLRRLLPYLSVRSSDQ
jgi:competence protein ComEA